MTSEPSGWRSRLDPAHLQLIEDSAIAPEVAEARGYYTARKKVELRHVGFGPAQCLVPALVIPVRGVSGEIVTYQARPDQPRIKKGKALKYETPGGSRMAIDVPPGTREWLGDPARPLFITEGARKADAGVSAGLCTIALLGVWNWRGANELGGKTALADWESIALNNGRDVYIVFDSDVMTKPAVHASLARLRGFLESKGARVRILYLPSGEGGSKVGLDDYLAGGGTTEGLLGLATTELRAAPCQPDEGPYAFSGDGRTVYRKQERDGTVEVTLANFTARITGEVLLDDGAEVTRMFRIEAQLGGRKHEFEIPAHAFGGMNWPTEHMGPKATIAAGLGLKDRLREAIQNLSPDDQVERRVYQHVGFRQVAEDWVYLHAGGGISAQGVVPDLEVQMAPPLDRYSLPAPPDGQERIDAIQASLEILDVAPYRITIPLLAATYTAPLGGVNGSVHLVGRTGDRKTELAALCQRHYGAEMDAEHLPGSWSSTPNALEGLAHLAKDAVLVIDDFNPGGGSVQDARRMHANADRLLRAQGNRSGRQRMRADGSLRAPRPPQGLILSTGEDVPGGHSLRARILVLETEVGCVDTDQLTLCQENGPAFSKAFAGYVCWLAPRLDELRARKKAYIQRERPALLGSVPHGRTATMGLHLMFGWETFLDFAMASGAMDADERAKRLELGKRAISGALGAQAAHQASADPVEAFRELLCESIQSRAAHLADMKNGGVPGQSNGAPNADLALQVGWREATSTDDGDRTRSEWRPGGRLVGWVSGDDVYLLPQAAYEAAQRMSDASPTHIGCSQRMLGKALDEAGRLITKDKDSGGTRRTKKVRVAGGPRNAWHLRAPFLFDHEGTTGTPEPSDVHSSGPQKGPEAEIEVSQASEALLGTWTGNGNPVSAPSQADPGLEVPEVPAMDKEDVSDLASTHEDDAAILEQEAALARSEPPEGHFPDEWPDYGFNH